MAIGVALAVAMMAGTASAKDVKIGLVVKSLGNGFFEAANKGAPGSCKELGGVQVIYTGPTQPTAEAQIEVINSLIAQGVDAIAISANDKDAVVPALKKATQRGIKVISWDSGVAPAGRILQLNPSSNELIGKMCLTLAKDHLDGGKGDFAILSATSDRHKPEHLDWRDEEAPAQGFPGPQPGNDCLRRRPSRIRATAKPRAS